MITSSSPKCAICNQRVDPSDPSARDPEPMHTSCRKAKAGYLPGEAFGQETEEDLSD